MAVAKQQADILHRPDEAEIDAAGLDMADYVSDVSGSAGTVLFPRLQESSSGWNHARLPGKLLLPT
ncbi:hypothetical protein J2X71_003969 [Rhizobium sp. 1399]|nr:hypothetical protein [Rhizobium sp. 1399]MDR6667691.1 hypothetical protein [Rhizobium sp. 1399]